MPFTVLITGSANGIGRATALLVAQRQACVFAATGTNPASRTSSLRFVTMVVSPPSAECMRPQTVSRPVLTLAEPCEGGLSQWDVYSWGHADVEWSSAGTWI
jgi:NAD(P)-dependent dehydrogenase (short-subunit alcohol dehydrogenase family)